MRLQLLVPPLPQTLVDALTSLNIRTDAELLFSGRPADIFRKLPPGTVDYQEFIDLVSQVTERAAAPAIRGDQLWDEVKRRREDNEFCLLSTGVPELDTLLDGMHPPRVIEVSGDRGSGKTVSTGLTRARIPCLALNITSLWPCKLCSGTSPLYSTPAPSGLTPPGISLRSGFPLC